MSYDDRTPVDAPGPMMHKLVGIERTLTDVASLAMATNAKVSRMDVRWFYAPTVVAVVALAIAMMSFGRAQSAEGKVLEHERRTHQDAGP